LDRAGEKVGEIGQPQDSITTPSISPDGSFVAVAGTQSGNGNMDIWLHEIGRGIKTRLTYDPLREFRPVWKRDGKRIAYVGRRESDDVLSVGVEAGGEPIPLVATELSEQPCDWSHRDGYLVFRAGEDLWYLIPSDDGGALEPRPITSTPFREEAATLSPNGRFLAYCSDRSGLYNVYVTPFPEGGPEWRLSADGGTQPRWNSNGSELFFVREDTLYVVPVTLDPDFSVGSSQALFSHPGLIFRWPLHRYDVMNDGQGFVVIESISGEETESPSIRVVQNWFAEFRDRQ
jgi:eukaryotic-like serine/threonine-protein kinase